MTAIYPCPVCRATADLESPCPGCGRAPDPDAAEVIRLDGVIHELTNRRVALASKVWTKARAEAFARSRPEPPPPPDTAAPAAAEPAPEGPETSLLAVQSVLFLLGGLLLAVGAIVFTAVAWTTFGVQGRAAILAGYTAVALAAPVLARRRGLVGTAETFAAFGLLLVVLDGYAARSVNLFGLGGLPPARFAGVVALVTAAVAAGYAVWTGLLAPRFAALAAAQPVLPLLVADSEPTLTTWALVGTLIAVADLALAWAGPDRAFRIVSWVLHGIAVAAGGGLAVGAVLWAEDGTGAARAGGVLLLATVALAAGAARSGRYGHGIVAGTLATMAVALAGARYLVLVRPGLTLALVATVVAGLAGLIALTARYYGAPLRQGARAGAWICLGAVGSYLAALALTGAATTAWAAMPPWHADLSPDPALYTWQLPAGLALLTAGAVGLLPRAARIHPVAVGGPLVAWALPVSVPLAWWAPSTVDLVVAAGLALWAARARSTATAVVPGLAALALVGHAVVAGLARYESTALVLGAVVLLGAVVAAVARRRSTVVGDPAAADAATARGWSTVVGGVAVAVAMAAWPGAVAAALASAGLDRLLAARSTLVAAALLLGPLVAARRWWPEYLAFGQGALYVTVTVVSVTAGTIEPNRPVGVYAALGMLVFAAANLLGAGPDRLWRALGSVPALVAIGWTTVPALWAVLVQPYGWLGEIWAGAPDGVGLSPVDTAVAGAAALALALLAGAVVLGAKGYGLRWAVAVGSGLLVGAVALGVAVPAMGARWPAAPATLLVLGLVGLVPLSRTRHETIAAIGAPIMLALAGAGLAASLPTKGSTLGALALTFAVALVCAAFGGTSAARESGAVGAVAAAVTFAAATALASGATARTAALWVVGACAAALAAGAARRSRAAQVTAHLGAVVGLAMTVGSARYAAAVCTLWGVAVGLRALWPGETARRRRWHAVGAAGWELLGWWLLLTAAEVAVVEAYTLPAAGVALIAGWMALRERPALRSWVAYGPALAAASLPSLATVLTGPGEPLRRLLLGTGAVGTVLVGSIYRRQAPVVVGGLVATVVALHELVLVWQKLPTWLPTTVAGLVLIALAVTFERRRRDMARLRDALARMS